MFLQEGCPSEFFTFLRSTSNSSGPPRRFFFEELLLPFLPFLVTVDGLPAEAVLCTGSFFPGPLFRHLWFLIDPQLPPRFAFSGAASELVLCLVSLCDNEHIDLGENISSSSRSGLETFLLSSALQDLFQRTPPSRSFFQIAAPFSPAPGSPHRARLQVPFSEGIESFSGIV